MVYRSRRAPAPAASYYDGFDGASPRGSYDIRDWATPGYVTEEPDGFNGVDEAMDAAQKALYSNMDCLGQFKYIVGNEAGAGIVTVLNTLTGGTLDTILSTASSASGVLSTITGGVIGSSDFPRSGAALRRYLGWKVVDLLSGLQFVAADLLAGSLSGPAKNKVVSWAQSAGSTVRGWMPSVLQQYVGDDLLARGVEAAWPNIMALVQECQKSKTGATRMTQMYINPTALKVAAQDIASRVYTKATVVAQPVAAKSNVGLAVGAAAAAGLALLLLRK